MFICKKLGLIYTALALPVLVATAQEAPKEGAGAEGAGRPNGGFRPERRMMPGGGMGMERQMQAGGPIFMRMLTRPEFIQGLGLPEETVAKLTEGMKKIEEQEKALREERDKLMKAQTEMMATLMSDRSKTGDDVRKSIEEIEAVQSKLFALNIDRMLVVRDNLTDEQIKQAGELVKKRFEARRGEMMQRRGQRPDWKGGDGAKDRRPMPPPRDRKGAPAEGEGAPAAPEGGTPPSPPPAAE